VNRFPRNKICSERVPWGKKAWETFEEFLRRGVAAGGRHLQQDKGQGLGGGFSEMVKDLRGRASSGQGESGKKLQSLLQKDMFIKPNTTGFCL